MRRFGWLLSLFGELAIDFIPSPPTRDLVMPITEGKSAAAMVGPEVLR
jgi:hypothetical protein